MPLSLDPVTQVITVPQADLTLVGGTLYEMDTDQFRNDLITLLATEEFIWMDEAYTHNGEVVVAGTTYARTIEIINGYQIEFSPDAQWSVRLVGSNNNLFDVENGILAQNQVQVIPGNSAGLQTVTSGSGVTEQDKDDIRDRIMDFIVADSKAFAVIVAEVFARMDLDSTKPNTYGNDGSTISGDDFTLTRTQGATTTTVQRS